MSASDSAARKIIPSRTDDTDLREQVRVLSNDVKELGRMTKDALADKVDLAKSAAKDAVDAGREKAVGYRDQLADATREKPMKSLLIAAGVGAVLGLILRRR